MPATTAVFQVFGLIKTAELIMKHCMALKLVGITGAEDLGFIIVYSFITEAGAFDALADIRGVEDIGAVYKQFTPVLLN